MGTTALIVALTLLPVVQEKRDSNAVFQPDTVKVLGALDYGKASASVDCSKSYSAFVFEGYGGDRVEIRVTGDHGTPFIALADSAMREVTRGVSRLQIALPDHGPAIEAWYIIFRNSDGAGQVTVEVNKTGEQSENGQPQTASSGSSE